MDSSSRGGGGFKSKKLIMNLAGRPLTNDSSSMRSGGLLSRDNDFLEMAAF
jgi:hypothetical protein